ncbi:DUF1707 domain-containing protein [Actinomadura syzygii]|uniref:DUF1707 SHOCT-like domain-containing protein n=1 Tax=Actinomadura syzygii TaxID=1427538 RepID=UPI001CA3298B
MPADPSSSPALRASDADRDQVIERLRTAVADGRLDPVEFDERLDAALTARTLDALDPAHHRPDPRCTRTPVQRETSRAGHHQGTARYAAKAAGHSRTDWPSVPHGATSCST